MSKFEDENTQPLARVKLETKDGAGMVWREVDGRQHGELLFSGPEDIGRDYFLTWLLSNPKP